MKIDFEKSIKMTTEFTNDNEFDQTPDSPITKNNYHCHSSTSSNLNVDASTNN